VPKKNSKAAFEAFERRPDQRPTICLHEATGLSSKGLYESRPTG